MSQVWETLLRYVLIAIVSYVAGSITAYRRARLLGLPLLVPFIPRSSRNFTLVVLALALVTTFSVVSGQVQARQARTCQAEFQAALKANASIATEDRELERQDDALREDRDGLTEQFWKDLLTLPPGDRARGVALTEKYNADVAANTTARGDLDQRRNQLEEDRRAHPYPEPRCGKG